MNNRLFTVINFAIYSFVLEISCILVVSLHFFHDQYKHSSVPNCKGSGREFKLQMLRNKTLNCI